MSGRDYYNPASIPTGVLILDPVTGLPTASASSGTATAAAPTLAEGSSNSPSTDLHGAQRVLVQDPAGNAVDYNAPVPTVGTTASGSAVTASPLTVGARAATTNPAAVTDGQVVNLMASKHGKLVAISALRDQKGVATLTLTSTLTGTTLIAAVAPTFNDIYRLQITNTSSTDCIVTIKDGTAGTTRFVCHVKAQSGPIGFSADAGSATPQAAVNTNWTATCSASVASIIITADYAKNT